MQPPHDPVDDITRYLQYSSLQATRAGNGIAAELYALQLLSTLYAERLQGRAPHGLDASMLQKSLQLLVQANGTPQAAAVRAQRLQAAAERAGLPAGYQLPDTCQLPKLTAAASAAPGWRELRSRGAEARRAMQQVSQRLTAAASASAAAASWTPGRGGGGPVGVAAATTAHQVSSEPMDIEGDMQQAGGGGTPSNPGVVAAAASKWGSAPPPPKFTSSASAAASQAPLGPSAPSSAAGQQAGAPRPPKRGLDNPGPSLGAAHRQQQQQQQQHHGPGSREDPIVTGDSSEDEMDIRSSRKQQSWQPPGAARRGQPAKGGGRGWGPGGSPPEAPDVDAGSPGLPDQLHSKAPEFTSARNQLVVDLHRKGQHQQATALQASAPRAGLSRGRGRAGGGGPGGGAGRSGFVPPFVSKAVDHHTGGGQGAAGGGGAGGEEGPLSVRTLQLLGVGEDGELPPELARHDPRLIEQVCNEVIDTSGGVSWEDIAGLATAKALVNEVVVWPMLNPSIFTGPRAPPKGLLLFGPPGTGKTLIGKAIASNIQASFFSISASSLTSKWIGEGEKMVKTLFAVAGCLQPSVIFIDEIDSILSARKSDGEHEASRRLKTEMLVQMEGCDPSSSQRRVLLIGATNRPEELDEAARRRMPKQLYIPLPCSEARRAMIERQLGSGASVAAQLSPTDLNKIVAKTDGYSGSDMRNLIQEACQGPVRDAVARLGNRVAELNSSDLRPVLLRDFQAAAKAQRASVTPAEIARYEEYNERHGAKYAALAEGGDAAAEPEEDDW